MELFSRYLEFIYYCTSKSGKARLHLLSPAKQDYTSESGKARPNQCSLGLYTYIIVCILRIRVSESRPYRTMTYLSADLARNDSVYFETPPCSYAPLLRMRTNFFNHHVLNTSFQDLRSGMGTRQSCLQSQGQFMSRKLDSYLKTEIASLKNR